VSHSGDTKCHPSCCVYSQPYTNVTKRHLVVILIPYLLFIILFGSLCSLDEICDRVVTSYRLVHLSYQNLELQVKLENEKGDVAMSRSGVWGEAKGEGRKEEEEEDEGKAQYMNSHSTSESDAWIPSRRQVLSCARRCISGYNKDNGFSNFIVSGCVR
jgi:hypothetical protein